MHISTTETLSFDALLAQYENHIVKFSNIYKLQHSLYDILDIQQELRLLLHKCYKIYGNYNPEVFKRIFIRMSKNMMVDLFRKGNQQKNKIHLSLDNIVEPELKYDSESEENLFYKFRQSLHGKTLSLLEEQMASDLTSRKRSQLSKRIKQFSRREY